MGLLSICLAILGICEAVGPRAGLKKKILGLLMIIVAGNIIFLGILFPTYGNNLLVLIASIIHTSSLCAATGVSYKMMQFKASRGCNDSKAHGFATGLLILATITAYMGYAGAVFWIIIASSLIAVLATIIIVAIVIRETILITYYPRTLLKFFKNG